MIKTNVPGLETDGKGVVVNRDLTKYHEMIARRKLLAVQEGVQHEVAVLREEVRELRLLVQALMEDRS